jgi:hypothetical protein
VDYRCDVVLSERCVQGCEVGAVLLNQRESRAGKGTAYVRPLQVRWIKWIEVIQPNYGFSLLQETIYEAAADKTSSAGNQNLRRFCPLLLLYDEVGEQLPVQSANWPQDG